MQYDVMFLSVLSNPPTPCNSSNSQDEKAAANMLIEETANTDWDLLNKTKVLELTAGASTP
jgi:4-hydroxy-3-methylbut-2-enyl diphosphate reductase IspH